MYSLPRVVEWKPPSGPDPELVIQAGARERLDRLLARAHPALSRTRWQVEIRSGRVQVDGAIVYDPDLRVNPGAWIRATPKLPEFPPLEGKPLPLKILYADEAIVVLDKPAGLVVHPGARQEGETLIHGLLHAYPSLSQQGVGGGNLRPGIVHRLDKGTSGVMVVALTEAARLKLVRAFERREVKKEYLAWVVGHPPREGEWSQAIARHPLDRKRFAPSREGKPALTRYTVEAYYQGGSRLRVEPVTGRTHQIRVHAYYAGYPLFGDPLYHFRSRTRYPIEGWGPERDRPALHARALEFLHPETGEKLRFEAPEPPDLKELDEKLRAL